MNKRWGTKRAKRHFWHYKPQHLIRSHLRGCLQAISLHWQYISPCRRKHLRRAPRGPSVARAEAIPWQASLCSLLSPRSPGNSDRLWNRWGRSAALWRSSFTVQVKSGLRFGEGFLHCFDLGPMLTWTWKTAAYSFIQGIGWKSNCSYRPTARLWIRTETALPWLEEKMNSIKQGWPRKITSHKGNSKKLSLFTLT